MSGPMLGESALRISDCVTGLLHKQPFFGSLVLRLPLRADPTRQTLASDGQEILYSPRWVAETDAHLIETAMARVVMACALKHHTRRDERAPERWQMASQLVTHALLRDAGFTLPPDAEAWEDLSVEQAYDRLPDPKDEDSGDDGNAPQGAGDAGGQPPPGGDDDESGDPSDPAGDGDGQDEHDGDDADTQGRHDDGRGQDANRQGQDGASNAPSSHDPSRTGEVLDANARAGDGSDSGEASVDIAAEEQAWDEAMHQALSIARAEGKAPGRVEETVRNAHASTLDWRTLLRRYMTDAASRDYSWSVPNRRFIDSGLYLPSIRSEGIDAIAVIIDTSGSVPPQTLAEFWAELREVAAEIRPGRIIVLQVDTVLQDAAEYEPDNLPEEIALKGRGGTDFRPGFEWLNEQGIQPSVCLYFTDMKCSRYPEAEPGFPVAWINWGPPPSQWNCEPWGERIDITA